MELGGFTGDRIWMIAAVAAFNLACIMLWFIVGALKRAQASSLKEAQTFIELMRREQETGPGRVSGDRLVQFNAMMAEAEGKLAEGEAMGPLWGRRHMTNANLVLHGLADTFPELSAPVNDKMLL